MHRALRHLTLLVPVSIMVRAVQASAAPSSASPLQVIMDGRDEAANSRLTEEGFRGLAQSGVNVFLYGTGAIGMVLVGFGLYQRFRREREGQSVSGNPWLMIVFGSLLTIPAIVAAVLPNAILGVP